MKKYAVIVTLIAIVSLSLGVFAQEKPAPPAKPGVPAVKAPMARVKEALNLTPEQEAKLQEFQKARQAENQAFGDQMKKFRDEMQTLRKDGKADPAKMNGLIDQMFKLQADRAKAGFKNGQEREKIFTPEQLEKMKSGRQAFGPMGQGMRMGMQRGMGMGMRMGRQQGMQQGMQRGMRMGMRPGMNMRGRMGMAPGQGMRMGMRPGLLMRGRMAIRGAIGRMMRMHRSADPKK